MSDIYIEFLEEVIFQTRTKWPHYKVLLNDLQMLASSQNSSETVVCLERAYIYNGLSLFAPIFKNGPFSAVDCQTETADERRGYQAHWLKDTRFLAVYADKSGVPEATGCDTDSADILIVPNLVHHVRNQDGLFSEMKRILKPGGRGYIFEALLRELHQEPDDYVRYTPWGFEQKLKEHGLRLTEWKPAGGPFEAVAYCWLQALQYIEGEDKVRYESWFRGEHFEELMALNSKYRRNLERKHTSFPVAYGIYFEHSV
ncbi:MAG: class I SAM-dependent methyltransferase [Pirellula sp.]|jgi:SAM-dependent methyltransferase